MTQVERYREWLNIQIDKCHSNDWQVALFHYQISLSEFNKVFPKTLPNVTFEADPTIHEMD